MNESLPHKKKIKHQTPPPHLPPPPEKKGKIRKCAIICKQLLIFMPSSRVYFTAVFPHSCCWDVEILGTWPELVPSSAVESFGSRNDPRWQYLTQVTTRCKQLLGRGGFCEERLPCAHHVFHHVWFFQQRLSYPWRNGWLGAARSPTLLFGSVRSWRGWFRASAPDHLVPARQGDVLQTPEEVLDYF